MRDWNEHVALARRVAERSKREFDGAAEDYTAARALLFEAQLRLCAATEQWEYAVRYSNNIERRSQRAKSLLIAHAKS